MPKIQKLTIFTAGSNSNTTYDINSAMLIEQNGKMQYSSSIT